MGVFFSRCEADIGCGVMGRPIGSVNREKPFNDALRIALRSHPLRLRRIAEKLTEQAQEGDLAAIRELGDRLDGKPARSSIVVMLQLRNCVMPIFISLRRAGYHVQKSLRFCCFLQRQRTGPERRTRFYGRPLFT